MSRDQADYEAEGLTIAATAHQLGVSENAIRQRIKRESIDARKIDGMWRIWLTEGQAPTATTRPVASDHEADYQRDHETIGRGKDGDHQADHEATNVATTVDSVPALIAQFESIRDQWLRPFVEDLNAKSERIGQLQERLTVTEQRLAAAEQERDELRHQVDTERGRAYLDQSQQTLESSQAAQDAPGQTEAGSLTDALK
jgi:chromosome segregation ATPase